MLVRWSSCLKNCSDVVGLWSVESCREAVMGERRW